jgi:hypothetical protein
MNYFSSKDSSHDFTPSCAIDFSFHLYLMLHVSKYSMWWWKVFGWKTKSGLNPIGAHGKICRIWERLYPAGFLGLPTNRHVRSRNQGLGSWKTVTAEGGSIHQCRALCSRKKNAGLCPCLVIDAWTHLEFPNTALSLFESRNFIGSFEQIVLSARIHVQFWTRP